MKHIQQFTYMQLFTPEECFNIRDYMDKQEKSKGRVLSTKGSVRELFTRNCDLAWVDMNEENKWFYSRIKQTVQEINIRWLRFLLDGGMEPLQYLEYGFGQFYNKHVDNSNDEIATRKLTAIIQLSDPDEYWGGDLKIDGNTKHLNGDPLSYAPKHQGMMTLFPSHLPHIAKPVWSGRRRVLVAWFHGAEPLR